MLEVRKKVHIIVLVMAFIITGGILFAGSLTVKAEEEKIEVELRYVNADGTQEVRVSEKVYLGPGDILKPDVMEGYSISSMVGAGGAEFVGGIDILGKSFIVGGQGTIKCVGTFFPSISVYYVKLVQSLSIEPESGIDGARIKVGEVRAYVGKVVPKDADIQKLNWSVENGTGSATIDKFGYLTAVSAGSVIIKAETTDGSGVSGKLEVYIIAPVNSVTVNGAAEVKMGTTASYSAAVNPENAENKSVAWSVENGIGAATIDSSGVLTPISVGNVIVKATATDGSGVVGTKEVTITALPAPDTTPEPDTTPKKDVTFQSGIYTYSTTGDKTVKVTGFVKGKSVSNVNIAKSVTYKNKTYQVTEVATRAFYKNNKIKKVTVGNNVTKLGKDSFKQCSKLTEVVLGNQVKKIKSFSFYKCTSLKKITIGTGLKEIGSHVFCNNKKLKGVEIKSSKLTKVGGHNFYDCRDVKIKVPSSKVKAYTKLFKDQGQKSGIKVTK